MKNVLLILIVFGLAACDAQGKIGKEESPVWQRRTSTEDKIAYFKPRCEEYGFKDGTVEMSSCVQKEIQDSASGTRERSANRSAAMATYQAAQPRRTTCINTGTLIQCY